MSIEERLRAGLERNGAAVPGDAETALGDVVRRHRTVRRRRAAAFAVVAAVGAVVAAVALPPMVERSSDTPPSVTSPQVTGNAPSPAMAGRWISHLSRERSRELLRDAGFGEWTGRFFRREEWGPQTPDGITAVYNFIPSSGSEEAWVGTFSVTYFETDRWHVGWQGLVEVDGDRMVWTERETKDRWRFTLEGDELSLDWLGSNQRRLDGIPSAAYAVAYLSDPLHRTDCPTEPGVDCPE